jgi:DmsE family decaheme c-type cytochrome
MNGFILSFGAALWAAVLTAQVAAGGVGAAQSTPAATQNPAPGVSSEVQAPPSGYAGADTCLTCHESQTVQGTPHGRTADTRTPMAQRGCESCHGPGQAHVDAGGDVLLIRRVKALAPADADATCTTCHNRGEHALWEGSQHESRNVTCVTCHSVHDARSENGQLVKAKQAEVCASCHRDKLSKLDRSGHMPVREGKLECTTCHSPHGATNVRLLRAGDSVAEACTSCHAEKRGPFLWEHAPVRDGCVTCHDPHGSSNERMLVAKPPILCQRCHVATRHPSTIYDAALVGAGSNPSIRVYARSCMTCHSAIHGSNHPSGQRFVR